jgi:DNA-binding transcriptional ArsR family regulator
VLAEPAKGGHRYQDLHDALEGISQKVLTETLRRAESDGLIARHFDGSRIETATLYELTDLALNRERGHVGRMELLSATSRSSDFRRSTTFGSK